MMTTILILTDFTAGSKKAADFATQLAMQAHATRLLLYHAYEFPPVSDQVPSAQYFGLPDMKQNSMTELKGIKEEIRQQANDQINIKLITDNQSLPLAVDSIIQKEKVDLVIMGNANKAWLDKLLLGNEAVNLIQENQAAPVLVVPAGIVLTTITNIALASDMQEVADHLPADFITSLLQSLHARLLVVNIDTDEHSSSSPDTFRSQTVMHNYFDHLDAQFTYLKHEDAAEALIQFVAENDVQLLIVQHKHHSLLGSLFHQSVIEKIVQQTAVPVLVLPERQNYNAASG